VQPLPAEVQELVDRQKIYEVLTTYCRALDRCDVELMKTVYWEDRRDEHGVFDGNAQQFAEFMDWNLNQPSTDVLSEGMFKALAIHGKRDRSDPIYRR